ncbi:hypothetical protein HYDPIDRAFT_34261 [Hydnomerulius pinastri MD-312]|uniref:Uncharacterized protein n=1 Tax=Hydnomerulius pinastri MD-312 TaxID=994086 RepID=A0A0C9W7F4_9AGAM|nr:hypothetical protein HYDPIDRAFT_34261 [Hydnomerulius pinastri MD-312]
MDDSGLKIRSFTHRLNVIDPTARTSLANGSTVNLEQISTHKVQVCIENYKQIVGFPLPADSANAKLRVDRKSMYIEIYHTCLAIRRC